MRYFRIKELKKLLKNQAPDYVISLGLGYQYLILGNLLNKYKFILSERNAPQFFYNWYEKIYVKYSYKKHIEWFSKLKMQNSILVRI